MLKSVNNSYVDKYVQDVVIFVEKDFIPLIFIGLRFV